METESTDELPPLLYDIVIIGAGPSSLAVAARLREKTPSAIFTDEEHQRYHWICRHRTSIKDRRTGRVSPPCSAAAAPQHSMLVLDGSGDDWLARWRQLFGVLDIGELRSPSFFHVDPSDRDALLAYAHRTGRMGEMRAVRGVVGKELSKHCKKKRARRQPREPLINERDRNDYYTPSGDLFEAHCRQCINRYGLSEGLVREEVVQDVVYDDFVDVDPLYKVFKISTGRGQYYARTAVLAIGGGNKPAIPGCLPDETIEGASHALQMQRCPEPSVAAKIRSGRPAHIMVIGGGLTSAQVTDLALRLGASKVWHIIRGPLRVKHFDLDLPWLGKFKNEKQAEFWTAETEEERVEMMKHAHGGGSIPPAYKKILDHHAKNGLLSLHTGTRLVSKTWDPTTGTWCVTTDPAINGLPPIDHIYYATGTQTDVQKIPLLNSIRRDIPIDYVSGLPCLNVDLMWKDDVPLFVTGKLASLQIGPGAANLSGARVGAERIAWGIESVLKERKPETNQGTGAEIIDTVRVNRFSSLEGDSSCEQ